MCAGFRRSLCATTGIHGEKFVSPSAVTCAHWYNDGAQVADIINTHDDKLAGLVRKDLRRKGIVSGVPVVFSAERMAANSMRVVPADARSKFKRSFYGTMPYMPAVFGMYAAAHVTRLLSGFQPQFVSQKETKKMRALRQATGGFVRGRGAAHVADDEPLVGNGARPRSGGAAAQVATRLSTGTLALEESEAAPAHAAPASVRVVAHVPGRGAARRTSGSVRPSPPAHSERAQDCRRGEEEFDVRNLAGEVPEERRATVTQLPPGVMFDI